MSFIARLLGKRKSRSSPQVPPPLDDGFMVPTVRGPGGFTEPVDRCEVRPRVHVDIPHRGAFTFPPPYGTTGVRLTNEEDGTIEPEGGYAYWRRINAHAGHPNLLVALGRVNAPPLLVSVNKSTLEVSAHAINLEGTGEQWYFSASDPDLLYVTDGPRLQRYDVHTGQRETVMEAPPGHTLWQCHSSRDDRVHSGTLRAEDGRDIGALVWRDGGTRPFVVSPGASWDECQVDASGRYLLIKETIGGALTNRVIDLQVGTSTTLQPPPRGGTDHSLGHSDMGMGYVVGEDAWHARPGAFVVLDLARPKEPGRLVYHMHDWAVDTGGMTREISHTNAPHPVALVSCSHPQDLCRANELVRIRLDGSMLCDVIAPNLCVGNSYRDKPKANLDPYGEWACWMGNVHGRPDAFLVRLP